MKKIVILIGAILLVLIGVGIYFFMTLTPSGKIVNGYWDEATQECWISQDKPAGESYPAGDESMFASCCFSREGDQVDCNNPENIIGAGLTQAVYGVGGPGVPGIFAVSHIITLTNDGSVPIDNIWINSAVWTPSHLELTNAYSQVIGSGSIYVGDVAVGFARSFPTGVINLEPIGGIPGSPITYNLDLTAKATAYGGELTSSRDISGQITVENEEIGFSIDINWGA